MLVLGVAAVGYATALLGFAAGAWLSRLAKGQRVTPVILGTSAGLLTAFICFDLLPPVFIQWGLFKGMTGLIMGTACAALLAHKRDTDPLLSKSSAALAAGVMLHNLPEGVALGAMMKASMSSGLIMAALLAAHCLPEAMMVFLSAKKPPRFCFVLALPMMLGSTLGFLFGGTVVPTALFLAFAAGMMLYIACGEMLPEAGDKRLLKGLGAAVGFMAGVLLITVHK